MGTLLSMVQAISNELGLAPVNSVVANQSQDVIQILALMNAAGTELVEEFPWKALNKEHRFTTEFLQTTGTLASGSPIITGISSTSTLNATYMVIGGGVPQDSFISSVDSATQVTMSRNATQSGSVTLTFGKVKYVLPADFSRTLSDTQWDQTTRWRLSGPNTGQEWQAIKSGIVTANNLQFRWRLRGIYFEIFPAPTSSQNLGFEYISDQWVSSSTGVMKIIFNADTDTSIFPDRLLILATKMRYFEIKGFDSTKLERDFRRFFENCKAKDTGAGLLSFSPSRRNFLLGDQNIPETGYGA